jgi:hypothetical protein
LITIDLFDIRPPWEGVEDDFTVFDDDRMEDRTTCLYVVIRIDTLCRYGGHRVSRWGIFCIVIIDEFVSLVFEPTRPLFAPSSTGIGEDIGDFMDLSF